MHDAVRPCNCSRSTHLTPLRWSACWVKRLRAVPVPVRRDLAGGASGGGAISSSTESGAGAEEGACPGGEERVVFVRVAMAAKRGLETARLRAVR